MITDFELKIGDIYLSPNGTDGFFLQDGKREVALIGEDELEAVLLNLYESKTVKAGDLK